MNKQQLANKIWESANKMRSKIEANEYKDYILGFIFYKYLSDQQIKFLKENDFTDEDIQKLADTFTAFQEGTLEDVKGFCAVADLQEIEKQDFILTPGRYVGIEEVEDDGEPFEEKMTRLTSELSDMFAKSHELEDEIRKKLGAIGYEV